MAYIANRPVRFDRDYKVGEIIPDEVIAPGMTRKLVDMGRILRVDLPQGDTDGPGDQESPQSGVGSGPDGVNSAGNENTQAGMETPPEGLETTSSGPEEPDGEDASAQAETFICEVCGRAFKSQNALAAHTRSHKD